MISVLSILKDKVWPWVKQHWIAIVIAIAMFLAGVGVMKGFMKPEIIEKTKIETVVKEVQVEKKVYVSKKDATTDLQKNVHKETTTTKYPDGTEVTHEVVDTDLDKHKIETQIVYKDRIVEKTVEVEKKVEVIKEVKYQKDWRVGIDVGTNIPNISADKPLLGFGNNSNMTLGLKAERRVVGPVWVGISGYLNGTVTAGVAVEF